MTRYFYDSILTPAALAAISAHRFRRAAYDHTQIPGIVATTMPGISGIPRTVSGWRAL